MWWHNLKIQNLWLDTNVIPVLGTQKPMYRQMNLAYVSKKVYFKVIKKRVASVLEYISLEEVYFRKDINN
jgi:hypothetical protein